MNDGVVWIKSKEKEKKKPTERASEREKSIFFFWTERKEFWHSPILIIKRTYFVNWFVILEAQKRKWLTSKSFSYSPKTDPITQL
mgnify:CR=1 FL=1